MANTKYRRKSKPLDERLSSPIKESQAKIRRIIIGITGATGAIYGIRLLEILREVSGVETHLVISKAACQTITFETEYTVRQVSDLAHVYYDVKDIGAPISSGSYDVDGMIVAPCSVKTLSAIAGSISQDLLCRAADVTLKEKRPLVLLVREAPLHTGHLRRMTEAAEIGATIVPPVPAFYNFPKTVDDIINHTVGRVLDIFQIDPGIVKRWQGMK